MDGLAAIRALREINPQMPIIAASGFIERGRSAELILGSVQAYLTKPYTAAVLLEAVHRALRPG
jgi:CheY-like chemotaxis protein